MDILTLVLYVAALAAFVLSLKFYLDFKNKESKVVSQGNSPNFKPGSNTMKLFDFAEFAVNELNKCGEEMFVIGKTKYKLTDENMKEITKPLKTRYDQLKYMKEHENWTMPLINVGSKAVNDLIKGLVE